MTLKRFMSAAICLSALAFAGSGADAANRYGLTCVWNRTDINLNYSYKWGNGSWRRASVRPGAKMAHGYRFPPNSQSSPDLYIRFDDDLIHKGVQRREYRLSSYASPQETGCQQYGKQYQFRYDGQAKKYIDLHTFD